MGEETLLQKGPSPTRSFKKTVLAFIGGVLGGAERSLEAAFIFMRQ
ncbi:hypothetical protein KL86DES1_21793 [uncultured Desulfovibrio sp.]|uniref:Uncharacterized protein n=1 Tax=uncultured Desulfovibrio sp. TaxID=167968 RepID=A0A212L9E8_9BACT|nr:hypothetical protein KL86DES1_21793 [uncultured Desulfovibrio sp.]